MQRTPAATRRPGPGPFETEEATARSRDEEALVAELRVVVPGVIPGDDPRTPSLACDRSTWTGPPVLPVAVVQVSQEAEVVDVLRIALRHRAPVVPRGAGTGLSGGANAVERGIVVDLSRMNHILEIDPVARVAVVEPGVLTADLDRAAAEFGLAFAPDPASAAISTIGGNIATNAGGLRCLKYGATRQSVLGLRVALAGGDVVELGGRTRKNVTGLDALGLLVGSEGTLGIVLRATVALIPRPVGRQTVVAACADHETVQRSVVAVMSSDVTPSVFELMDRAAAERGRTLLRELGLIDTGAALLIVQTDGHGARVEMERITAALVTAGAQVRGSLTPAEGDRVMAMRRGDEALGTADPQVVANTSTWWLGEDMTLPATALADFLAASARIAEQHGVSLSMVAHVGDGNLHPAITLPREGHSAESARHRLLGAADALVRRAHQAGGALSGEHGIGVAKLEWLPLFLPVRARSLMAGVKAAFDPEGIMNPGKAV